MFAHHDEQPELDDPDTASTEHDRTAHDEAQSELDQPGGQRNWVSVSVERRVHELLARVSQRGELGAGHRQPQELQSGRCQQ